MDLGILDLFCFPELSLQDPCSPYRLMGSSLSLQFGWRVEVWTSGSVQMYLEWSRARELAATGCSWLLTSAELGHLHDFLGGLLSLGPLRTLPEALGLHPIMWPPQLRLCPSSCFSLCCPASAPRVPRRLQLSLLRLDCLFLGACRLHLCSPRRGMGSLPGLSWSSWTPHGCLVPP